MNDIFTTLVNPRSLLQDTFTAGGPGSSGTITIGSGATMLSGGGAGGCIVNNGTYSIDTSPSWKGIRVKGDAEFESNLDIGGDISIKGKSLSKTLQRIEERLAILHPNEALEEKWENLRGLGKAYRELEVEILEKEKAWAILKK